MNAAYIFNAHTSMLPKVDRSLEDFIFDTVSGALQSWSLTMKDIDGIVTASSDQLDGRAISIMVTGASAGSYGKDLINLSSASEHALFYQVARVLAERTTLGLVISWGKPSECSLTEIARISADPFFGREVAYDRQAALDMETQAFVSRHNLQPDDLSPLGKYYAGEIIDGDSCTVLLVGGDPKGRGSGGKAPLRVCGMGMSIQSYWNDPAAFGRWPALAQAAGAARRQVALADFAEIDTFELSTLSPAQDAIAALELGLARPDGLSEYFEARQTGRLAINRSGGLRSAYPDFGAGLLTVERACAQLWSLPQKADRPRRALAHGYSGFPPQAHAVFILERSHG